MDASTYALASDRLVLFSIAVFALAMLALAVARATRPADVGVPVGVVVEATVAARTSAGVALAERGRSSLSERTGTNLLVLGLVLTIAAATTRGLAAGRTPWANMYEFTLVGSIALVLSFLVLSRHQRTQPVRAVGVWVAAAAALFLGLGLTVLYVPAAGLIPVLDSAWLVIHVAAAIVAGGLFTVGAATTVLQLIRLRQERSPGPVRGASAARLERAAQSIYTVAFPIWTFAVLAGAIWAENSWGRYWGWDPKETWAFITWVCYAAYLHAQATAGWRGRRASWLALAGYAAFWFNFVGVNLWVGGLHSYSGV